MKNTKIQWTFKSWNPVTGCTKISPGCVNCYAEKIALRLQDLGQKKYVNGFKVTLHEETLNLPLKLKKPCMIFVNSMSDLFHKEVPVEYIQRIFRVMRETPQHQFQILTKRSKRLLELNDAIDWPPNVWMGVTVENKDYVYRIDNLRKTGAAVKLISFEPLLGLIKSPDLTGIDWAIVGGESGSRSRPIKEEWIIEIRDTCLLGKTAFFFKQWGGSGKDKGGRVLEGKIWKQYPETFIRLSESSLKKSNIEGYTQLTFNFDDDSKEGKNHHG